MEWILIIGIVLIAVYVVYAYNKFIRLIQRTKEAWADIDVQLKKRYDLIPNLVETVKGYASHERETLESVIEARNRAMHAEGPRAGAGRGDAGRGAQVALRPVRGVPPAPGCLQLP